MSRVPWARVRDVSGVVILLLVVLRVGLGPFVDGVRMVDASTVVVAVAVVAVTTSCCAWRWILVARGLGLQVPFGQAVAAYYRSQLLNSILPGGVLGDVHRGLTHGHDVGDVGRGVRAVAWERAAGQAVQVALTVLLLVVLPSPVHDAAPWGALAVVAVVAVGALVLRRQPEGSGRLGRAVRAAIDDVRHGLLARGAWPGIVLASAVVLLGQAALFVVCARAAGTDAPLATLLPIALLVLLAMALPLSIGGWGPREGVAAWAFGAAGLGAALGVSTAVVYGVVSLLAALPGLMVLALDLRVRRAGRGHPAHRDLATEGGAAGG